MRPIDADSLPAHFDANYVWVQRYAWDNAPTLDVRPNIHAHWIKSKYNDWICSCCHIPSCIEGDFCPWCGAEMSIEENSDA